MCRVEQVDLKCSVPGCETIIFYKAERAYIPCPAAEDGGLEFGQCGVPVNYETLPDAEKAESPAACNACKQKRIENHRERYEHAAKYVEELRNAEQTRDDERRMREEIRSATPRPAEQAALVFGAGTGWYSGPGGGAPEAFGTYPDAGMFVSAMPQELELGPEDDMTQQGEDDAGEGSSRGQHHRHTHGHR